MKFVKRVGYVALAIGGIMLAGLILLWHGIVSTVGLIVTAISHG